jgi:hypothetical protein
LTYRHGTRKNSPTLWYVLRERAPKKKRKRKPEPESTPPNSLKTQKPFRHIGEKCGVPRRKKKIHMSKLMTSLVFFAFLCALCGFTVLAVWDLPVTRTPVEKTLDSTAFLNRNT